MSERVSAAAPSAGTGLKRTADFIDAKLIKDIPIWTFHGSHDNSVPVVETEDLVESLREAGNQNCKFTIYPGAGHVAAWEMAYSDPNTWKWLFAQ